MILILKVYLVAMGRGGTAAWFHFGFCGGRFDDNMWQEYIITAVTVVLTLSIIPTLRDGNAHVPLQTSGLTAVGLMVKAVMFGSLGMVLPAVGAALGSGMWALLAYLRSGVREQLRATGAARAVPTGVARTDSTVADYAVADD